MHGQLTRIGENLLAFLGHDEIDQQFARIGARGVLQNGHDRIGHQRRLHLDPVHGRALVGADEGVVVEDLQPDGIFAGNDEIEHLTPRNLQGRDVLLRQARKIFARLLFAHGDQHAADEALPCGNAGLDVPGQFALPFGIKQILEGARLRSPGNEIRVEPGRVDIIIAGDPIALGIEELLGQIHVRRPLHHQAFALQHDGGLHAIDEAGLDPVGLGLVRYAKADFRGIGADVIDAHAIFALEGVGDGPHDLVNDLHRVPGDLSLLLRGVDQRLVGCAHGGDRKENCELSHP